MFLYGVGISLFGLCTITSNALSSASKYNSYDFADVSTLR